MIQVKETKESVIVGGHAGYAEHGKDIICSAVSILTLTLIESLKKVNGHVDYELEEGKFYLNKSGLRDESNTLISSFFIGIDILYDMYPDYITRLGSE